MPARFTGAAPSALPRIALYAGAAIGYPYYAYYAHCLLSLGLSYRTVSAQDVAQGTLKDADLLVMPGGFATWGLDRAENRPGVDAAIAAFLDSGGAYIGSCGGAFYLSAGRPGWHARIPAKPIYTHEYLLSGACLLNVRLDDPALRGDLPDTLEMPYYHGPVYNDIAAPARTLGRFDAHILPSRLFIDNPLDAGRYAGLGMAGRPAVVRAGDGTRAIVFSSHPEMGEFVRKGIALDSYVRRYLPIRGQTIMSQTLRFYETEDCLSFRLVFNAMDTLGLFAQGREPAPADASQAAPLAAALAAALDHAGLAIGRATQALLAKLDGEPTELAELVHDELGRCARQWAAACRDLARHPLDAERARELMRVLNDAARHLDTFADRSSCAETMVLLELPVRLAAAAARIALRHS